MTKWQRCGGVLCCWTKLSSVEYENINDVEKYLDIMKNSLGDLHGCGVLRFRINGVLANAHSSEHGGAVSVALEHEEEGEL
jgi:hypothetical protein